MYRYELGLGAGIGEGTGVGIGARVGVGVAVGVGLRSGPYRRPGASARVSPSHGPGDSTSHGPGVGPSHGPGVSTSHGLIPNLSVGFSLLNCTQYGYRVLRAGSGTVHGHRGPTLHCKLQLYGR